ncbi:MAG TPA: hypothetical protein VH083_13070 [Myxococcales bacterium]|nr:hypothetical protein [Myxococcales bacterium]
MNARRAVMMGLLLTVSLRAQAQVTSAVQSLSLKVLDEAAPPGGAIQIEVSLTEPRPIIIGSGHIRAIPGTVLGVVLPGNPDAGGTAVTGPAGLVVRTVSSSGNFGLAPDAPIFAVAVGIPATTALGTTAPLALDAPTSSFTGPSGLYTEQVKPGVFTAKNIISITNVVPGGGLLAAGSTISILGVGFQPGASVEIDGATLSKAAFVSAGRVDVVLGAALQLDAKRATVRNPDGTRSRYYSYLRAASLSPSTVPLLAATDAVYPVQPISLGVFPAVATGGFMGIALQNPGAAAAQITIQLRTAAGVVAASSLVLPPLTEVSRAASELFPSLSAANVLSVSSSSPVQMLGLQGDAVAGTVTPVLPAVSN